jgi:RHS repeat-associated protein
VGRRNHAAVGAEVYNYFRDYDPSVGRYVESDPIGLEAGVNTYSYVGADPLTYFDPRGKAGTAVGCAAGAWFGPIGCGIGAAIGTAGTIILGGIIANSIGSDSENDPVKDQKPFNPGRDCDGKCNPCPPTIKWDADGNKHGSTSGRHGHGIRWDQNPQTCWCYPSRLSGPSTDSLK